MREIRIVLVLASILASLDWAGADKPGQMPGQCLDCDFRPPRPPTSAYPSSGFGESKATPSTTSSTDLEHGICTTADVTFRSTCWIQQHNELYSVGVTINSNPNACAPTGCPCAEQCSTIDHPANPFCVVNAATAEKITYQNFCQYQCDLCNNDLQFLHCGPCNTKCKDIHRDYQCIPGVTPPRICQIPATPPIQQGNCICFLLFAPVCGIDTETRTMMTFPNSCVFECDQEVMENRHLELIYDGWSNGTCDCQEDVPTK